MRVSVEDRKKRHALLRHFTINGGQTGETKTNNRMGKSKLLIKR
jgi:hypothetical protein